MNTKAMRAALYWGVPPLFCLILYWPGLKAWFQDDDFAWLNLLPGIHTWGDLWYALFHPTAHGTWRPLSERAYFITLQAVFGAASALPFRIVTFLVQFANLALIASITRRLTNSPLAGFLAPILWIANSKLVIVMAWNSAFMYALCGLLLLAAFWFFLRYIETSGSRYWIATWAAFLLGFTVMETIVIFPLLVAAYTFLCARPYFKRTLPLFVPSFVFTWMHQFLAPPQAAGVYSLHVDFAIFKTFGTYWAWVFEPVNLAIFTRLPERLGPIAMVLFTLALLGFATYEAIRRNFLPAFFLSWFGIVLMPVLPLREHISDYYLTLPVIGIAMLGAYAFARAWHGRIGWRAAAIALIALFLMESAPAARGGVKWYADRSRSIKNMVTGVAAARALHPGKLIVLDGIDGQLFWGGISQHCFNFLGINDVYLAPGAEARIGAQPELGSVAEFILPADRISEALSKDQVEVYVPRSGRLKNVTSSYTPPAPENRNVTVTKVDVSDPRSSGRLGPTWYPIDQGFRWMPKRASVRLTKPGANATKLSVSGYCPALQTARGPLKMIISIDGGAPAAVMIEKGDAPFTFDFPLASGPTKEIEVVVEVDRTFSTPADRRELGLGFGVFEIR